MSKIPEKHPPLMVAIIFLFATILGFLTVLILPLLFVMLLQSFILQTREPVRCDGGEASTTPPPAPERAPLLKDAPLPGVFEKWIREHLK